MKPLVAFRSNNVMQPCRKAFVSLGYKLKKRLTILIRRRRKRLGPRSPSSRSIIRSSKSKKTLSGKVSSFISTLFTSKKKMDRVRDLSNSFNQGGQVERLLSFPNSPKKRTPRVGDGGQKEDVEDACRSFENYLVEMIVEEGKVRDLMDVEELLYCWKNLNCPVFIDLVSRFYGELCKDLFMDVDEDDINNGVAAS